MTQDVTGCKNCPMMASHFDGWGGAHCNHPETEGDDLDEVTMKENETPDWCPLKKEPITIEFKK